MLGQNLKNGELAINLSQLGHKLIFGLVVSFLVGLEFLVFRTGHIGQTSPSWQSQELFEQVLHIRLVIGQGSFKKANGIWHII